MSLKERGRRCRSVILMETSPEGEVKANSRPSTGRERVEEEVPEEDITCDYSCCAPQCCQKFRNMKMVLFWMCWATFVQSMMVNGFVNSVITTLERRYRLSSTESGAIASLYDVGVVIVLIPLSYLGGKWRRLRVLAWGLLVMGTGAFVFALPQATSGVYVYKTPVSPLCYRNSTVNYGNLCDENDSSLNSYKFVFWLAHLLVGVGASPLYTLGTAYIDANLSAENSALYLGIFYTMSLLGPGVGYLSASFFLDIYVDIGRLHPGLTSSNREFWVGAWWIGFLIAGFMSLIAVLPFYGFPKELPSTAKIRATKKSEAFGDTESSVENMKMTVKDFVDNCKVILTNPTFMFISLSGVLESMLTAGFSTFGPKYLETVFQLSAADATRRFGFVLVPAGGLGMFLGGFIIRCAKMSMISILRMQFIAGVAILPFLFIFLLSCGSSSAGGVAGLTTPYSGVGKIDNFNLTATCNADCNCKSDSALFEASCGTNRMTYYSPCFAGCISRSQTGYGNCSCISTNASIVTNMLTAGSCTSDCTNQIYFLLVFAIIILMAFFIATPSITTTLRSVPEKQKTFALGIQWLFVRIIGTIPGPIIFGALIDTTCDWWNERCGEKGSCAFYNDLKLRDLILIVGFVIKILSAVCLMVAWLCYKQTPEDGKGLEEKTAQGSENDLSADKGHDNPAMDTAVV